MIGGAPAAAVVFSREVRGRALADPRVAALRAELEQRPNPERREAYERLLSQTILEQQAKLAAEFDAIHSVGRALDVGSLEKILEPSALRPFLVRGIAAALGDAVPARAASNEESSTASR